MKLFSKKYLSIQAHIFIWFALFLYPFLFHYVPFGDVNAVIRIACFIVIQTLFFYGNTYLLVPRLLKKKTVLLYLALISLIIVLIGFASGYLQILFNEEYGTRPEIYQRAVNTGIVIGILSWGISTGLKVTSEWFRNQERVREIENERLQAELSFLKSQINPHFLFNALNNIYSLENKKSPNTGPAILKLSELIRYMLYDTQPEFVPLEKEIEYLRSYVELQKLSLSSTVETIFRVSGDPKGLLIRPMLLIPVIENMFKHGISYSSPSVLEIDITISSDQLEMTTRNPFKENHRETSNASGIGLRNLKKRLNLLYPGKFSFLITGAGNVYVTTLNIQLK